MEKQQKILEMAKDICRVKLNCNDVCNPISACDALRYAERAVEAGYSKQEWISVKERLPKECKNVLCVEGNKTIIAFMEKVEDCGTYVPVFWDWIAYDRDDTYDEVCATHWMPLPEAPKMKGGGKE